MPQHNQQHTGATRLSLTPRESFLRRAFVSRFEAKSKRRASLSQSRTVHPACLHGRSVVVAEMLTPVFEITAARNHRKKKVTPKLARVVVVSMQSLSYRQVLIS